MPRLKRRVLAFAAVSLAATPLMALAQQPTVVPSGTPDSNIFNPNEAPEIIIHIGVSEYILTIPHSNGSETTITKKQIQRSSSTNLTNIIASRTPGVAQAPNGHIHVRGSHGQYTYYLDGAPLPVDVNGSFSDLINPRDIKTLQVIDGAFAPMYGGQITAIFNLSTIQGHGKPNGYIQQLVQGYNTYQTTVAVGGSQGPFSYFLSGVQHSSDFFVSPETQTPHHDSGLSQVGFGKFVYQPHLSDRFTLDTEVSKTRLQIPNTALGQSVGQNDNQTESSSFTNLIWKHGIGPNTYTLSLYSHNSHLHYVGSPQDLLAGPDETFEDVSGDYVGVRLDKPQQVNSRNLMQYGFDIDHITGHQTFTDKGADVVSYNKKFAGGDQGYYIQDDWTPGRYFINYGARYDIHQADITTSQLSPRVNITYHVSGHDDVSADYDRMFQPIPLPNIINLNSTVVPFQPERDDFFQVGWHHHQFGTNISADAYYRAEKYTVDDSTFANTQIDIPENFSKGYARGIEFAVDGPFSNTLSYYANFARSWAKEAGPIIGGLIGNVPNSYFYDDHDQTNTASFGLDYDRRGLYTNLDGEYGSGYTFGETDLTNGQGQTVLDQFGNPYPIALDFLRTEPHLTFNLTVGKRQGRMDISLLVDNLLNYGYILKQAGPFTATEWAPGRVFGTRVTYSF